MQRQAGTVSAVVFHGESSLVALSAKVGPYSILAISWAPLVVNSEVSSLRGYHDLLETQSLCELMSLVGVVGTKQTLEPERSYPACWYLFALHPRPDASLHLLTHTRWSQHTYPPSPCGLHAKMLRPVLVRALRLPALQLGAHRSFLTKAFAEGPTEVCIGAFVLQWL